MNWSYVRHLLLLSGFIVITLGSSLRYGQMLLEREYLHSDFRPYYTAGYLVRMDPEHLYDWPYQEATQERLTGKPYSAFANSLPFVSPVMVAWVWSGWSYLSPALAYRAMQVLLFGLYLLAVWVMSKIMKISGWWVWLLAFSLAGLYQTLLLTQTTIVSLWFFIGIYYALRQKQLMFVGLLVGLMWYMPPMALLLTGLVLVWRKMKIWLGLGLGLSIHLVLFWLAGISPISYLHFMRWFSDVSVNIPWLISFQGMWVQINWLFPRYDLPVWWLSGASSLLLAGITLYRLPTVGILQKKLIEGVSLVVVGSLLVGMHIHHYQSLLLVWPLFNLVQNWLERRDWKILTLIMIGWVGILVTVFTPLYPKPVPVLFTLYLVCLYGYFWAKSDNAL